MIVCILPCCVYTNKSSYRIFIFFHGGGGVTSSVAKCPILFSHLDEKRRKMKMGDEKNESETWLASVDGVVKANVQLERQNIKL